MVISLLSGFLCTAVTFILCGIVVVGTKSFCLYLKRYFAKPEPQIEEQPKPVKRPRQNKTKSIEIDADSVDKIFFKKSS